VGIGGLKWRKVDHLLGEYEHTIDEKNRLTLPARFRPLFAAGLVLTRGLDGCLYAYARDAWERLVASRLEAVDPLSPEGRLMERFFFSGAAELEPDRQGRIVVPAALAQRAKLGREVVIAGVRDRLEIWNRGAWRKQLQEVEGRAEDVAQRLAERRV
jgi:MraZ protein